MLDHPLVNLAIAIAIGALVGIDREQRKREEEQHGAGGLRTFMLIGLLGGLVGMISQQMQSAAVIAAGVGAVLALIITSRLIHANRGLDTLGLTTDIAMLAVFFLGALVMMDQQVVAVALGIGVAAIVAFKERLHGLVEKVGREDLYAVLKLLIASGIVLPVLPNETIDPWGTINPYKIWWLVILISGLSLVGYVLTRWLGPGRGAAITGLVGGLASSTAVSLEFARRSKIEKETPGIADALASGVLLAWVVMFVRVIVIAGVIHPPVLKSLAWSMGAMGAITLVLAAWFLWRGSEASKKTSGHAVPMKNPFSLWSAIKFAAVFSAVIVAVDLSRQYVPTSGLYIVALVAGLTDVDAITLSMAQMTKGGGPLTVAAISIVIAVASNTIVKMGMSVVLGSAGMRNRMIVGTAIILAVGAGVVVVKNFV
jgi:uncharacterized membrane protein (DUF4010 family)